MGLTITMDINHSLGMILTVTESTRVQVGLRTEQNARRRQMQQAMRSTGFGGGVVLKKNRERETDTDVFLEDHPSKWLVTPPCISHLAIYN